MIPVLMSGTQDIHIFEYPEASFIYNLLKYKYLFDAKAKYLADIIGEF
jgi:hypothetical protein